ncbi:TadE/TadG family type IV pilus assembly protein [Sphingomonas sp. SAFR-052]|uniref:TadE/TadG family type IV pilus assembly protein n=1 Tax=Sphingomonas sp. SAFR-052 TaxID=3436867 RepID=UPI003F80E89E
MHRRHAAIADPIQRIPRDRRGAVTLEFGLCAAAFLTLLIGTLQIALVFFVQHSIQTAAESVARRVLTGQIPTGTTRDVFRGQACAELPAFLQCEHLYVDVRQVPDLASVGTVSGGLDFDASGIATDTTRFDPGGAGAVVVLRLIYDWPLGTLPLGLDLSNQANGSRSIIGTMVFKSEPYA